MIGYVYQLIVAKDGDFYVVERDGKLWRLREPLRSAAREVVMCEYRPILESIYTPEDEELRRSRLRHRLAKLLSAMPSHAQFVQIVRMSYTSADASVFYFHDIEGFINYRRCLR